MSDPLLVSKVKLPILRHHIVARKEVLRRLREGFQEGHLLSLVCAPAGYGKTTAVRMWIEELDNPVAWVTLQESDSEIRRFLACIVTAMQCLGNHPCDGICEVVESAREIDVQRTVALLADDVRNLVRPLVLVLEDYHLIGNDRVDRFIESILSNEVANLHLVITTREDPDLPVARMRVRNQLTEIRAKDLSFSLDEAGEFFSTVMGVKLSAGEIETLNNRTEGWIAGLQLAALSLKQSRDPATFVEAFRGTHRHVLDYLIDEVLKSQAEEIREFLRRTSILDQMSPSLCEAVTGQRAAGRYLHYLENNNLFLVSLDDERCWYRYHALFGELLKNQLMQVEPELVDDLHERAAGWYEKNGFVQTAIEHAFQMSNYSMACRLIEDHAIPLLYQGEVSKVAGWVDRLPKSLIQSSSMLCVSRAWALVLMLRRPRTEEVMQALRAAQDAQDLPEADKALGNSVAGQIASIQAYILRSPTLAGENPAKLIETSERAQQLLPEKERGIRSVNALNIGYGYLALADLPAAETGFKQALDDGLAGGNLYAAVYGPINLIMIALARGQLTEALQLCETNIGRFNRLLAGKSFPPIGALHILKGSILLEEGHLEEADECLSLGLNLVRWTGEFVTHAKGYAALARLLSARGDRTGVVESVASLEESLPEHAFYAQALRHRLSFRNHGADKNSLEEAQSWVTKAAADLTAQPEIVGIDHVSEIRFQACLSTVHIVARLTTLHPNGFPLEDVHRWLATVERFALSHELFGWLSETKIAGALLCHVERKHERAQSMIQDAIRISASRGYYRIFLDEADLMRPLLESVLPCLQDIELASFGKSLVEAMSARHTSVEKGQPDRHMLRGRELEVLRLLAAGKSYKEIGEQLYLSLNTVQFHVKNIYSKLSINSRSQAVDKAREMNLI